MGRASDSQSHSRTSDEPHPAPQRAFVLGATGYIGSRLVPALLAADMAVAVGVRDTDKLKKFPWGSRVTAEQVDVFDADSLAGAIRSGDVLYYLVHSMDGDDFIQRDREAAQNVVKVAEDRGVNRIVYLSGLIPAVPTRELSDHLYSRLDVETTFTDSATPSTTLRAAIILGAGSASFELLRQLSERVPVVPLPGWLNSDVQPISVRDILTQLVTAGVDVGIGPSSIDVGGPQAMRYADLIHTYCHIAGLRRPFIPVPFLPRRFVGLLASRFVDLPPLLVQSLVDSLGHSMVCDPDRRPTFIGDTDATAAIRASLSVAGSADDPHRERDFDPAWAGGDVEIRNGSPRITGQATGGVGWGSRRTQLPVFVASVGVASVFFTVKLVKSTLPTGSGRR